MQEFVDSDAEDEANAALTDELAAAVEQADVDGSLHLEHQGDPAVLDARGRKRVQRTGSCTQQ